MHPEPTPPLGRYYAFRDAGYRALQQGHLVEAESSYARALTVADEVGDGRLKDLSYCNWAATKIELGEMGAVLSPLREILLRSTDPSNCRLAAYHIARIYELRGESRKGLFYARIARDRTAQIEQPEEAWIASNHNLIANFLVADSHFADALEEYQRALEVQPKSQGYRLPAIRQNIGFCHLMLGRPNLAFPLLFSSLRAFRKLRAPGMLALNHLDLAYAYLEIARARPAIRHATRALSIAQELDDESKVKNALYLLGEAWHVYGDDDEARRHFTRLGERYDDLPFIADFLLAIDVRQVINLRA